MRYRILVVAEVVISVYILYLESEGMCPIVIAHLFQPYSACFGLL